MAIAFAKGLFTVQKTDHVFSCIAIDHAHEQSNAVIKGDGGLVGITDNPSALHRWMIAGPEVAGLITEFESTFPQKNAHDSNRHHDQTPNVPIQHVFGKDVQSLVATIKELGNAYLAESTDLIALGTKEMASASYLRTVQNVKIIMATNSLMNSKRNVSSWGETA